MNRFFIPPEPMGGFSHEKPEVLRHQAGAVVMGREFEFWACYRSHRKAGLTPGKAAEEAAHESGCYIP